MSATVNVLVQRLSNPMPRRAHPSDAALRVILDRQTDATYRDLADVVFGDSDAMFYPRVGALLWERLTDAHRRDVVTSQGCFPKEDDQDALFAHILAQVSAEERTEVASYLFRQVAQSGRLAATQTWLTEARTALAEVPTGAASALNENLMALMGEAAHQAFVEQQPAVGHWLLRQPNMEVPVMERIRVLLEEVSTVTDQASAADVVSADLLCQCLSLEALEEVERLVSDQTQGVLEGMPHLTQRLQAFRRQDRAQAATPLRERRRHRRS